MIYLITHGERESGPDPKHTKEGIDQIKALLPLLPLLLDTILPLPDKHTGIQLIVSGTGKRFLEILEIVSKKLPGVPVKYSPFCGGPEGFEGNDQVVLTDGRTINYHTEYVGLANGPIDMWQFIASLPDEALLCAGGALMIGLGFKDINQKGHLFEIDPVTKTCRKIS